MHGFTGRAEDWRTLTGKDPSRLAIDLPGHGRRGDPLGTFRDEIQALLQELPTSIERIVGYSFGGRIALGLIQAAPERFRAATIISAHPGLTDSLLREQRREADQRWIQLLRTQGVDAFVQAWEKLPLFVTQSRLPRSVLARQQACRLSQRAEGLASSLERLGLAEMPSTWDDLMRFPGQLRWIVGGEDRKFLRIARQVAECRPTTDLRVLDGIGHNPLLESPDLLADLL
ncbi:alpha/beta fold hydrolase [Thiocystis violascens]|uniref:Putative hydrolase or acyltransferase of alpha/beta superfamily n=1 Tax=Thiocystis violascens (strain ATCC 17096 / DSM 198 / 6111) TaxID=765911 RepID=I3YFT0_THIV6|nr:alpha/beta fold hydrolase [Thiocystis violascens]AFL75848.1 putative hydrolase or acyltransferase of alpha/beta superfamily [Thiocystis violascens DSM 198]